MGAICSYEICGWFSTGGLGGGHSGFGAGGLASSAGPKVKREELI